ncbi:MAG: hypothetical protein WD877_00890 [Candidatus Saccharimonadales bacterium]
MAKIYIAARAKYRANEIAKIQKQLQNMDHEITYDWPAGNIEVKKPYRDSESRKHNLSHMQECLEAAKRADIFILIDDEGLRGAYVEYGAFLADCLKRPNGRRAYIVGKDSHQRESIFESPQFVKFVDTIEEVYEDLRITNA